MKGFGISAETSEVLNDTHTNQLFMNTTTPSNKWLFSIEFLDILDQFM